MVSVGDKIDTDSLFEDLEAVVKRLHELGCSEYRAFLGIRHVYSKVYKVKFEDTASLDSSIQFPEFQQPKRKQQEK
ncbi:hypothetical protein [Rhodococcus globerulus]|uniref:Uncharacterized protein n=1 Tax=Rhodococcus globerulus TaxID=33008 RepID=A0ABU4BLK4_RHOGO|nr:hypothetical protein [Rhodococcus globerulus]MDV6265081.1 hypothetical protein [Rhodococcus globerulus]